MFDELDPLFLSQIRLAVMSLLIALEEADFSYLKDKTQATAGNLSVQLNKLKKAGYITMEKTFRNNYPLTMCRITKEGIDAFEKHVQSLRDYIEPSKKNDENRMAG